MRRAAAALLRPAAKIFFRRIEIVGAGSFPEGEPALLVLNHPNSLVDPLLVLLFAPRPVSFLAKAPLFHVPLVGRVVRAFDSIPVHRRQDGVVDPAQTRETFARARAVLERGGLIALFPEGASHGDPRMRPARTGAARIALGASLHNLQILPAGLFYTAKGMFRSGALLLFGQPLTVVPVPLDPGGEPPADAVRALTAEIERALAAVTLQAETHEAHRLAEIAGKVFPAPPGSPLEREFALRRRLLEGYARLNQEHPDELERVAAHLRRFDRELEASGLDPADLAAAPGAPAAALRSGGRLLRLVPILPFAALGFLVHYPIYRAIRPIAVRLTRGHEDVLATSKIVASCVLFPLAWIAAAALACARLGLLWGLATLAALPACGIAALRVAEDLDEALARLRALRNRLLGRFAYRRLLVERDRLRAEIESLEARLAEEPAAPPEVRPRSR